MFLIKKITIAIQTPPQRSGLKTWDFQVKGKNEFEYDCKLPVATLSIANWRPSSRERRTLKVDDRGAMIEDRL